MAGYFPLWMDDDTQNLGNSPGSDARGRLHTKISNTPSEPIPISVSGNAGAIPTIENLSVPSANTEVSYAFPSNTSKFSIRSRANTVIKFAFASGQSGTNYFTIPAGGYYAEDQLSLTGVTIYLQSSQPGQTLEILSWQSS